MDYLKKYHGSSKIIFVEGSYESLAMLDDKTRQGPFVYDSILKNNSVGRRINNFADFSLKFGVNLESISSSSDS